MIWVTIQLIAMIVIVPVGIIYVLVIAFSNGESCHNPSSHGEVIKTNKTAEKQRQKKTPDSLEGDSGEDEAHNTR